MEVIQVAEQIEKKIRLLEKARAKLKMYAEQKAETLIEYEKKLAITMIQLKNGIEFNLDSEGEKVIVKYDSVSTAKDYAKAVCHKEGIKMELAEALYKNCVIQIETIQAEMNGYQSIFRYFDVSTEHGRVR